MFRQQYNEEVKKLLRRGKKKAPTPSPVPGELPADQNAAKPTEQSNADRKTPTQPTTYKASDVQGRPPSIAAENGPVSPSKKPTTAVPAKEENNP